MKITVIAVGKLKEKYLKSAVDEYSKRIRKYYDFEVIEVPDEKTEQNASISREIKIRDIEGERILKKIKEQSYVIALAIEGKEIGTEKLSKQIKKLNDKGIENLVFIIGGSIGLSEKVLKRANYLLSFSKMTFPHQLMRVILLEQISTCISM